MLVDFDARDLRCEHIAVQASFPGARSPNGGSSCSGSHVRNATRPRFTMKGNSRLYQALTIEAYHLLPM